MLVNAKAMGDSKSNNEIADPVKDFKEGEWCAICHGHSPTGGDLLYCCDNCPRIYHPKCYVPTLVEEPDDDWVCMMCISKDAIRKLPKFANKTNGNMGVRDLRVCERLMFELFGQYPESNTFHFIATLHFDAYRKII